MFEFGPKRVVQTGLSPEQALAALRKAVAPGPLFALDRPGAGPSLRGTVGAERFTVVRRAQFLNSFTPIVEGVVVATETGSQVQLSLGMHLIPFVTVVAWISTTAFLAIWTSRAELESLTMPLALLSLVAPALAFVAYRTDVDTVVHEISLAVTTPSAP
ncbi:MAG: hypothetical protein JNM69_23715 [Archangium sp.]|nr:hypothetical protein [Archangium sp.]